MALPPALQDAQRMMEEMLLARGPPDEVCAGGGAPVSVYTSGAATRLSLPDRRSPFSPLALALSYDPGL